MSSRQRQKLISIIFVSVFAFLLASFPARNTDLWMHLAAGRQLAQRWNRFGTTAAPYPDPQAHNAWLYDLASYGVYSVLEGGGLVVFKALLMVGLALVLLYLSRTSSGWGLPAACTALALLTMGTRLQLQPATVSCFFLGLTLWFLRLREENDPDRQPPVLPPWPLMVLFVVWVNVDSWFVLGLGTAALVWLGQALDYGARGPKTRGGMLRSILCSLSSVLCLAAVCFLNPSHVFAFDLPAELGWFAHPRSPTVPFASSPLTSPFQGAYLKTLGVSPASLAYFALLALGILSFLANLSRWHWQRFLPWLGLALWSAGEVRAIPFFAVVAGPVLAWNLQEWRAARRDAPRAPRPSPFASLCAGALGLALLVCAWPGWLQAPPFEPRRWAVETPPSLERGAAAMTRWHQEGKLGPETRGLHLSRETASAFAWFCPETGGLVDDHLASAFLGNPATPEDWYERVRAAGVNHVIVYDRDRERLFAALGRLLNDPEQWPLLYLEGDLAVFGRRDPARGLPADPFEGWKLDVNRLAFRPSEDKKAPRRLPEREPEPRVWWDAFWKAAPPPPIDRNEAALHLFHAEVLLRSAPARHLAAWEESHSAALVGAAGGWMAPGGLLDAHMRLMLLRPPLPEPGSAGGPPSALARLALAGQKWYTLQRDDTPPAVLYLAVRAARRALAINPADAQAHAVLGESYLRLLRDTRERAWSTRIPELAQLRRAQASVALNQAVFLKPDLARAHRSLGRLYGETGYVDLALTHHRAYLKLAGAASPPSGSTAAQFREQVAQEEQELNRRAKLVEDRENSYAVASAGLRVLERAMMALQHGLAGKARDVLLDSDVAAFGPQGMALELELQLRTGRAKEVREWTSPEDVAALGQGTYHWLRIQALAALGDYASAGEECTQLASGGRSQEAAGPRELMALSSAQAVLDEQTGAGSVPSLVWRAVRRLEFRSRVASIAQGLRQEADVTVLRGLLALEEGDVEEAEVAFRLALSLWKDEASAAAGGGLDFNARVIAQDCLAWLE